MAPSRLLRNPPFRAEHIGSLLRPKELLQKRDEFEKGEITQEELTPEEDKAIKTAVDMLLKLDYHSITDGEYRRHQFWGNFFPNLDGMGSIQDPPLSMFREYAPDIAAFTEGGHNLGESIICTSKIKHTGNSVYLPEYEYLKSIVPKERWGTIKITLPAPEWYHFRYKHGRAYPSHAYANDQEYFADIAKAYNAEIDILYKAGLRNAQIDDPNMAYFCSEKFREGWAKDASNPYSPDDLLDAYINLYNDCLSTIPSDMHVGLHICRGNFVNSRHFSEGGYDIIATKLFTKLNVNTYYLEYDTPRAGTFAPLAELPAHKSAILGVVTSKFPKLEDKEEMVARIKQGAKVIAEGAVKRGESSSTGEDSIREALNRLGVSPQCGFASHKDGNALGLEDMERKLKLVKEIANEIWPGEP